MLDLDIFWLEMDESALYSYLHNVSNYDLAMEWYFMDECFQLLNKFEPCYNSFLFNYLLCHLMYFFDEIARRFYKLYENTGDEGKILSNS